MSNQMLASRAMILSAAVFIGTLPAPAQEEQDTSGTNPANLGRSAGISNEYRFLGDGRYYDVLSMKYTEPFADGKMSLRMNVPINTTNVTGDTEFGIGDIGAKVSWVPFANRSTAFIVSGEVTAPTASEDVLGSGKWTFSPGIVMANFISREVILAPAFVHTVSFAGDDSRGDINISTIDLYAVFKPTGKKWWLTADFTASYDFESEATPMSFETALGFNIGKLDSGGAINGYVRPGVGIGDDRPYDFNIEVGVSLVGF